MDDPFHFLQDDNYDYPYLMHGECNRTQPLDSSLAQPLPGGNTYHYASSLPTTLTVPWLSPISDSSPPVDSSPTSLTGSSATTGSGSRDSSPESIFSTPSSSSPICSPTSTTLPSNSTFDDHTVAKRGLPAGRIKRPANAFMCFRTYFCKNKPRDVERHNATVSKITGIAWRRLSDEERVPYIAQAAAIKAEFMAKHPDWVFKPRRNRPMKRSRKTQQRTLADEQRYTRIALGFNSGKRGKDLKRLAEMAETAGNEEAPAPPSRIRRNRKSIGTTKAPVSKLAVFTSIAPPPSDSTIQSIMEHTQIPVGLPPSNLPEHFTAVPPSLPRHSLLQELQPDDFFSLPSATYQSYKQFDLSSILMEQDNCSQAREPNVDSLMSQLHELAVDSTVARFFDQQQFSPLIPDQLAFDDILNFPSEFSSF